MSELFYWETIDRQKICAGSIEDMINELRKVYSHKNLTEDEKDDIISGVIDKLESIEEFLRHE